MSWARAALAALGLAASIATSSGACSPELGELPATCPDGTCPEGYECIHGVCAAPGTPIPITIESTDYLRSGDLLVVPQEGSVLVLWETYAYSSEGQSIRARRLFPDGSVSEQMLLDDTWVAAEAGLEPYFDLEVTSETSALLAITSGTIDDAPEPRLRVYRVELPSEGNETDPTSTEPAWDDEVRLPTLGYGGISRPRFVRRSDSLLELGYFQSRTIPSDVGATGGGGAGGAGAGGAGAGGAGGGAAEGVTIGELAVFDLDEDGTVVTAPPPCQADSCCVASACTAARASQTLAVGVTAGYALDAAVTWVLDDERPSVLLVSDGATPESEQSLPNLSVPLGVVGDGLLVLVPSARTGDKLPTDPVEGAARLQRVAAAGVEDVAELPTMHDTPRPATLLGTEGPAVVVSPGASAESPTLTVHAVDVASGSRETVAEIQRFSTVPIGSVRVARAAGKLFVVWLDQGDTATIRAAIVDAP